jgi:hypothetical protein
MRLSDGNPSSFICKPHKQDKHCKIDEIPFHRNSAPFSTWKYLKGQENENMGTSSSTETLNAPFEIPVKYLAGTLLRNRLH